MQEQHPTIHEIFHEFQNSRRVLVIDDDPVMREIFAEVLDSMDYETTICGCGEEAWTAFQEKPFPLVVVDWNLPDITGIELCQRLRKLPYADLIFILMATGNNLPSHLTKALEAGADDYLTKPFKIEELQIRMDVAKRQIRLRLEHARAVAERDREHRFLERLMNAIPIPLFCKDTNSSYTKCNAAFEKMLGKKREEVLFEPIEKITTPEQARQFRIKDRELFNDAEKIQSYEQSLELPSGEIRQVIYTKAVFNNPIGKPEGIIGVIQDITELRAAEQALIRAQQLAAVGTLAAGVAHEFNNINTSILGNLQLLTTENDLNQPQAHLADRALSSARRAADLTMKLLSFAGPAKPDKKPAVLNDIVSDTVKIIENEFASEGAPIEINLGKTPIIYMDAAQIGQVLMNLLINARHACLGNKNKKITVTTGTKDNILFFSVTDNGCGIPKKDIPKLFVPFFSTKGEHSMGETVQSKVKGTGLGLSISDTIVRDHSGEITVESSPDHGSTFTVWLPIPHAIGKNEEQEESPTRQGTGLIAVLDDETDVREVLHKILTRKGHEVVEFSEGEEALKRLTELKPDLILVDLQMPSMTGFEFLDELAKFPEPKPKAIVLTGKMDLHGISRRNIPGVVGFLEKPFDIKQLTETVSQALNF